MKIRRAKSSDLSAVESLLTASDLPTDGVRDNFSSFVVADDNGAIAGAIGLEKYGSVALLRSAVVAADHRGTGVGGSWSSNFSSARRKRESTSSIY